MAETDGGGAAAAAAATNGHRDLTLNIEDQTHHQTSCLPTIPFLQKLIAEVLGTYFVIFAGCAAVVVNADKDKVVPAYVAAQVLGSTLASGTLRLVFSGHQDHFAGTLPVGSDLQSLVLEFIITFYLMPISGASMNPARSLGPAIVSSQYKSIWIYMLGPIAGAIAGAWVYNIIRFTDKPLREITKSASFLRYAGSRNGSKR
ncbi:Aquaporin-like protein [Cynara cardunculus var. scolymus]|uniref:Aquaporin-like protein n=1 Tax=Cynara cardunculus var. scolymus TaxID=59895 RepID=A0A103Y1T4_CYNCS|nr:Aquaporin-like protein [Cynara cardunculus var. scolymus]